MLDSNVSTYIDKNGNVQEVGSGGTVDASTLNGVITGTNGITTALNTAGDKVEVKLSNSGFTIGDTAGTFSDHTITINPNDGEFGAYISLNYNGSVCTKITPYDIRITDPGGDVSYGLTSRNVKTLFGQSIYGRGKIDLYRHIVTITMRIKEGGTLLGYVYLNDIISSSNTRIESLTELYKLNRRINATGTPYTNNYGSNQLPIYVNCSSSGGINTINIQNNKITNISLTWSQLLNISTLTITDEVTTV